MSAVFLLHLWFCMLMSRSCSAVRQISWALSENSLGSVVFELLGLVLSAGALWSPLCISEL